MDRVWTAGGIVTSNETHVPHACSQIIVFGAGVWELLASAIILYGIWNFNTYYLELGSLMLVLFTIMATLIFYVFPFKYLPFLSNLTTTCALFLLPYICVKC